MLRPAFFGAPMITPRLVLRAAAVCVLAAVVMGPTSLAARGRQASPQHAARGGAQAKPATPPPIRIVDLKGLEAAIAAQRGKAVLVNFWAIWCEPCVAELPEFLATGREYRDRNAVVLTVSYDLMIPDVTRQGVLKTMRAFVASHKIDAPVFIYDALDYDAINERFGLPGPVPVTIAIDAQGAIVERHIGQATREQFQALMRKAVGSSEQ
jgi:thiol-disulfide isomerase/thioredoxin